MGILDNAKHSWDQALALPGQVLSNPIVSNAVSNSMPWNNPIFTGGPSPDAPESQVPLTAPPAQGGGVSAKPKAKPDAAAAPAEGPPILPPMGGGGPVIPAGMRPKNESLEIKGGVPVTPELQTAERGYRGAEGELANAQVAAEADAPRAALEKQQALALAKFQADEEARKKQEGWVDPVTGARHLGLKDEMANEMWKRNKARASADLAIQRGIDPDRYFHNMSVGGKLAMIGALAAGGFVSGYKGGPNQAMDFISKEIDRDIDAQKEGITNAKGAAEEAENHFQLFRKEGMNADQASAQARALAYENYGKQLDQMALTAPPQARLRIAQLQSDLAQKAAQHEQEYAKLTGDTVTKKVENAWKEQSGGGAGGPTRKEIIKRAQEIADKHPELTTAEAQHHALAEWQLEKSQGAYPTKAGAAQKPNVPAESLDVALQGLHGESFAERHTPESMRSSEGQQNEAALANAVREYQKAQGQRPSPLTLPNKEVIQSVIGRPTKENVQAFVDKATEVAKRTRYAAPGAPEGGGGEQAP